MESNQYDKILYLEIMDRWLVSGDFDVDARLIDEKHFLKYVLLNEDYDHNSDLIRGSLKLIHTEWVQKLQETKNLMEKEIFHRIMMKKYNNLTQFIQLMLVHAKDEKLINFIFFRACIEDNIELIQWIYEQHPAVPLYKGACIMKLMGNSEILLQHRNGTWDHLLLRIDLMYSDLNKFHDNLRLYRTNLTMDQLNDLFGYCCYYGLSGIDLLSQYPEIDVYAAFSNNKDLTFVCAAFHSPNYELKKWYLETYPDVIFINPIDKLIEISLQINDLEIADYLVEKYLLCDFNDIFEKIVQSGNFKLSVVDWLRKHIPKGYCNFDLLLYHDKINQLQYLLTRFPQLTEMSRERKITYTERLYIEGYTDLIKFLRNTYPEIFEFEDAAKIFRLAINNGKYITATLLYDHASTKIKPYIPALFHLYMRDGNIDALEILNDSYDLVPKSFNSKSLDYYIKRDSENAKDKINKCLVSDQCMWDIKTIDFVLNKYPEMKSCIEQLVYNKLKPQRNSYDITQNDRIKYDEIITWAVNKYIDQIVREDVKLRILSQSSFTNIRHLAETHFMEVELQHREYLTQLWYKRGDYDIICYIKTRVPDFLQIRDYEELFIEVMHHKQITMAELLFMQYPQLKDNFDKIFINSCLNEVVVCRDEGCCGMILHDANISVAYILDQLYEINLSIFDNLLMSNKFRDKGIIDWLISYYPGDRRKRESYKTKYAIE